VQQVTTQALRASYEQAMRHENALTDAISTDDFSAAYPARPGWAIGPFSRDDAFTFRPFGPSDAGQWRDPTGIGWTSSSIFNPTLIEKDGELRLFYRASPHKESLASHIGHAVYRDAVGWVDDPANPIVYPTLDNELLGCEDPKVYSADGRYYLFYNGIWPLAGAAEVEQFPSPGNPLGDVGCDINLAVSDDLVTWQKLGLAVPHEVSRLWAKGAVIAADERGEAVRFGDDYLMFLSEGCNGELTVGRSTDMVHWRFEPVPYLDLSELGRLHEVACAVVTGGDLVLDFFYGDGSSNDLDGRFAAGQARYDVAAPFTQLDLNRGGSLAWGGLRRWRGAWTFAQGWDAPPGERELYLYRTAD
jgi:Predicted glycosylase